MNRSFSAGSCREADYPPLPVSISPGGVCIVRMKAFAVLVALSATSLPAFAQSYRGADPCAPANGNRQAVGAVVGAVVGGLLGNGVASHKNREEGALLGGVVGAVAGSEIGRNSQRCSQAYSSSDRGFTDPRAPYPDQYSSSTYNDDLDGQYGRSDDYGYGDDSRYGNDRYSYQSGGRYEDRYNSRQIPDYDRLAHRHDADRYPSQDVTQQCEPVRQKTRLPDGSVEVRTVEACRRAYYGDWKTQD